MKIDKKYIGFTLAEMMIVLVIVAIIVTVLTPMITKKRFSYTIPDTIWRANGSDIYFGLGSKQSVLIGGKYDVSNIDASLIVNTENDNYIPVMFNETAGIYMGDNNKLMAGNVLHKNSDGDYEFVGNNSVLIRSNNKDELNNPLIVPSGNNNTIIGNYAFGYSSSMPNGDITGNNNAAIGTGALKGGYCSNCIAVGYNALAAYEFTNNNELPFNFMLNDTRDTMRAFGYYAGAFAKGGNMRAFGPYAGYNSVSPTRNFAFLPLHGVGDNYFLGYYAGASGDNTECTNVNNFNNGGNLYAGAYAGFNSCNSINNVSIGPYAGYSNRINEKIKSNNYNIGPYAGFDDTQPTEPWSSAGTLPHSMLNAGYNINIGYHAGHRQNPAHFTTPYNFISGYNINIGYYAGRNSNGERNTFIGTYSGKTNISDPTNSPIDNGYSVTDNKCIGYYSCSLEYASATGYNVNSSGTGIGNTGIGAYSMAFGNGNYNTAIGYSALHSENSEESISVGVSGYNNTAIGYEALGYLTTGDNNTAIGHSALRNLTTGFNNTAIGYNACSNLRSGSNKTCIGNNTEVPTAGYFGASNTKINFSENNTKVIVIGDENSKVYLGDAVVIGGASGGRGYMEYQLITPQLIVKKDNVYRWQPWWFETDYDEPPCQPGGHDDTDDCRYYSYTDNIIKVIHHKIPLIPLSQRHKGEIIHFGISTGYYPAEVMLMQQQLHWNNTYLYNGHHKDSLGVPFGSSSRCSNPMCFELSDKILKSDIKPYNLGLEKIRNLKVYDYTFKTDEEKTMHVGVVAQELQKIFPYAVKEGKDGFLTIRTEDILYSSVNAVKQLHNYISGLFNEIVNLENKLSSLQIRKNTLKKENAMLKEKIAQLNARLTKIENKGK